MQLPSTLFQRIYNDSSTNLQQDSMALQRYVAIALQIRQNPTPTIFYLSNFTN